MLDELQQAMVDAGLKSKEDFDTETTKKVDSEEEDESEEPELTEEEDSDKEDKTTLEDDGEEDEDVVPSKTPTKGIPARTYNQVRSQLREERAARQQLEEEISSMKQSNKPQLESDISLTEHAKRLLPPDATDDQLKATEEQLKVILELTAKKSVDPDKLAKIESKLAELEDKETFENEWIDFRKTIKGEYQDATPEQYKEAKKVMDELAHAPQFADKEFDYVYFKNREIFNEIFHQKKSKTFETRDTYVPQEDESDEDLMSTKARNLPPKKLEKLMEKLQREAEAEDNKSGWRVQQNGVNF